MLIAYTEPMLSPVRHLISVVIMTRTLLLFAFSFLLLISGPLIAAKPDRNQPPAIPVPEVYSVKVDYTDSMVLVEGQNLDPLTASAILAGVPLEVHQLDSTDTLLKFPFTEALGTAVGNMGNYVLVLSNDGGSFTATLFIPYALAAIPEPPPPGPDCPCSTEWDEKSNTMSPNGFRNQTPFCVEDRDNFMHVEFNDPVDPYIWWVLETQWSGTGGYCELKIDYPRRTLTSRDQFDACVTYLRGIVEVWGNQGGYCVL
jgi:hypothetical protein